tara:strand:- start:2257 stop:4062 length:1806 start_codon:yes stop_codon:yes gene_type:complete
VPFDKKKIVPINYTSRDFATIKRDLVSYAKRYYPDNFQDFSEASFGSLMLDTVAYVGDILSFYVDYSVNESFLDSAVEYNNVTRLAKQLGYKYTGIPASSGEVTLYIVVPASSTGAGPDLNYAPILRRGAKFQSGGGTTFTLNENVDFSDQNNEVVVAQVNSSTGVPTKYAIKTYGQVISGDLAVEFIEVGSYERFPKFTLSANNVSEVVSVTDSSGNEYFEVDYLSQDVIYRPITNNSDDKDLVPFIMQPYGVPRRFITETIGQTTTIQFGHGSEANLTNEKISDPSKVVLSIHGRDYVTDKTFDPTNLIETDTLGVAPSNTTLQATYRTNSQRNTNLSSKSLVSVSDTSYDFGNVNQLGSSEVSEVLASLEFENEKPIVGSVSTPSSEEIKYRAYGSYNSQNRAVTKEDYISMIYNMPPKFGAIKRANIAQDKNSFKRNINLYVISEDVNGSLTTSTDTLKKNLKTWITNYKMLNDTIDIMDAKIVNVGIEFEVISDTDTNKFKVLSQATEAVKKRLVNTKYNIGEPLRYGDIFQALKNVDGLLDVVKLKIVTRSGASYSSADFDLDLYTTPDGRMILAPEDIIFEIKYPDSDIRGTIK